MRSLGAIRRLHQHRDWSNRKLRQTARSLSDEQLERPLEIGQGSLMKTFCHLYAAEVVWLLAIHGEPNTPSPFNFRFPDLSQLEAAWDESEIKWSEFLGTLTSDDLDKQITKVASISGHTFSTPLSDILLHVCTHAQYTTAQAVNMMKQLGVPSINLPDTMLITMSRDQSQSS